MENTADRTVRQEPDGKKNRTLQEHAGVGPPAIPAIAVLREPLKIHINDHDAEFTQPAEEKAKEISIKLTPMEDVTSGWIWGVPRFEQALFSLNWVGVQSPYRLAERQKIRRRLRGLPPVAKMEGWRPPSHSVLFSSMTAQSESGLSLDSSGYGTMTQNWIIMKFSQLRRKV